MTDIFIDLKYAVPIAGLILALLVFLHTLLVKRKEATIEAQDKELGRLKLQLDEAKNSSPDILAERYKKKIDRYEAELKELMNESEANSVAIKEKEQALETERANVARLTEQMSRANEILEDYQYFKEQFSCPYCGAETTTLANDENGDEYRAYACGHSSEGSPCPHDPHFPTLAEFEFVLRERDGEWFCSTMARTDNARRLKLYGAWGRTQEEAQARMVKQYEFAARNVPKNRQAAAQEAPKQAS
jgi:hypothetical protein